MITLVPFKKELITDKESIEKKIEIIRRKTQFNPSLGLNSSSKFSFKELEGIAKPNMFKIRRLLSFGYSAFIVVAVG